MPKKDSNLQKQILYRVVWKSRLTGYIGHGQYIRSKLARLHVKYANEKYGDILTHWLEANFNYQVCINAPYES